MSKKDNGRDTASGAGMLAAMKHYFALLSLAVASLAFAPAVQAQTTIRANEPGKHARAPQRRLVEIRMDDDFQPKTRTAMGRLAGYDPVVTVVHRGDRIRFVNVDDIRHTATGFAFGGGKIPANYKFQGDPSTPHGAVISQSEWSTGNVAAHGRSRIFQTGSTGTFYYGCAYHSKMRGAIVVK